MLRHMHIFCGGSYNTDMKVFTPPTVFQWSIDQLCDPGFNLQLSTPPAVFQPAIDQLCDPDFINQKVYEYVHHHQLWRELHQRTYTYAASYEDFIGIIQESNDVDELKHIRSVMALHQVNNDVLEPLPTGMKWREFRPLMTGDKWFVGLLYYLTI